MVAVQAPTILKQLEERVGRVIVRIVSLACTVVFILHIFACVFHYVALLDERSSTWVELSGIVNQDSTWDRCAPVASISDAVVSGCLRTCTR